MSCESLTKVFVVIRKKFHMCLELDVILNASLSDNCTWDNQSREFSNGIISEWMNIASNGRPLNSWPSYDPSNPKYFHLTPDQGFSV